jgi:phosphatidylglycerol---prolipoprotein diacylglyceryl transferase
MINYIYWNPRKEIFIIPGINFPIVWYSLLFLSGFFIGYYIFIKILNRYFSLFPNINDQDIFSYDELKNDLKNPKNEDQQSISKKKIIKNINSNFQILSFLNNFIDNQIENRFFLEKAFSSSIISIKKKIAKLTDKLLFYMIVATVIGARLGHLIFYEKPEYYLKNPLIIIKTWQGGLASHGAAVAILIAIFFLSRNIIKFRPKLSYIHILDFICVPTSFAAFCIRIGNFFNQEIIGVETAMPWGVVFGNPMENVSILPRHPVQLYEAFFYLLVFFLLFYLSSKKYFLLKEGKLFSLFLILVFTFRFFIEFLKVNESQLINSTSLLSMGQYLSIPFVFIGIICLFCDQIKSFFLKNNKIID